MRLSVRPEDPGFCNFAHSRNVTVYLDGKRLNYCITADDEEGTALVCATDKNGRLIIEYDGIRQEMLTGRVEFVWGA